MLIFRAAKRVVAGANQRTALLYLRTYLHTMRGQLETASEQDFRLLGLGPEASPALVKKAYRDLVKRWHPDHFQQSPSGDRQLAEDKLKEITGAYRRISRSFKSQQQAPFKETAPERAHEQKAGPADAKPFAPPREPRSDTKASPFTGDAVIARMVRSVWRHLQKLPLQKHWHSIAAFVLLFCLIFAITSIPLPVRVQRPHEIPHHRQAEPQAKAPDSLQEKAKLPDEAAAPRTDLPPETPLRYGVPSARPSPPNPLRGSHFTLGSTQAEVLRVQGIPTRIRGQTWVYELSEVQFRDGRVWRYNNFDGSLKVRVEPATLYRGEVPVHFTLGSTRDEVLLVQGTPTRVENNRWYYGFSVVHFRNGRVENYDNYFGNLNIRLLPAAPSREAVQRGFFSIGSTQDDVLAVQGTPTSIQGNLWFYQFSNIMFRNGKVQYVIDSGNNLRFTPPEG